MNSIVVPSVKEEQTSCWRSYSTELTKASTGEEINQNNLPFVHYVPRSGFYSWSPYIGNAINASNECILMPNVDGC